MGIWDIVRKDIGILSCLKSGYWDTIFFNLGPDCGNGASGYWDIMPKKRDIAFLKWGYWDITLGLAGPFFLMCDFPNHTAIQY